MTVDKLSISMNAALSTEVRTSARDAGQTLSTWIAEAARERLRREALDAFFRDYEREHGAFTEDELTRARADLGYDEPAAPR